jgi:hypothetical protein
MAGFGNISMEPLGSAASVGWLIIFISLLSL